MFESGERAKARGHSEARKELRDASIRLRAILSAMDELLAIPADRREDVSEMALRADLDVPATLARFKQEASVLEAELQTAQRTLYDEQMHAHDWSRRVMIAVDEGSHLLAAQAIKRLEGHQHSAELLQNECAAFGDVLDDYRQVITLLESRALS